MKTHLVTYHHGTVGKETSEQHRFMELDPAKPLMPQIRQALPTSLSERLLVTRVLDMEGKPVAIAKTGQPYSALPALLDKAIARALVLRHGKDVPRAAHLAELGQECRGRRVDAGELKRLTAGLSVLDKAGLPDLLLHLAARRSLL